MQPLSSIQHSRREIVRLLAIAYTTHQQSTVFTDVLTILHSLLCKSQLVYFIEHPISTIIKSKIL
nr:MAG TPA: hypothetical protein [Caudoviricetes sp.]